MNNEAILQSINKSILRLMASSNTASGLDRLLDQLFAILNNAQDLPIEPRGVIASPNPQGQYFQVARFNMGTAWDDYSHWRWSSLDNAVILAGGVIRSDSFDDPAGGRRQLLLLPLNEENQHLGYLVLFAPTSYQPSAIHLDFLADMSRILSGFMQRTLTGEILQVYKHELKEAHIQAIQALGVASEYRDNETGLHIMRMTNFTVAIARTFGLPDEQLDLLHLAAPMHDVGKIGIADNILLKPGKLTLEEFSIMKTHTTIGVSILSGSDAIMAVARDIAGSHHERWDGTGYPAGLAGEQIPLLARICAVADVFDALTSKRPYKKAWAVEEAAGFIISESGKSFDPAVVHAFEAAIPEILRVRELYSDNIIDPNKSITLPPLPPRACSWVEWNDSLSIGIDAIDEHHHYLIDLINDLFEVVSDKSGSHKAAMLIKATVTYASVHFRAEEQMMRHYGYVDTYLHEQQHQAYETKANEFYDAMHVNPLVAPINALFYLRDWLVNHICVEDIKLRSLIRP